MRTHVCLGRFRHLGSFGRLGDLGGCGRLCRLGRPGGCGRFGRLGRLGGLGLLGRFGCLGYNGRFRYKVKGRSAYIRTFVCMVLASSIGGPGCIWDASLLRLKTKRPKNQNCFCEGKPKS